jgi:hypothetical protein
VRVDQAHREASEACKRAVHCALAQHLAVDAVVAGGGDGADDVAGVDVLDVRLTLRGVCLAAAR